MDSGASLTRLTPSGRPRWLRNLGRHPTSRATDTRTPADAGVLVFVAERVGFEPTNAFWTLLEFQSSAFDHSATSPDGVRRVHGRRT